MLTSRGVPLIYYGDEIGMTGGPDPDNRRDFPAGEPVGEILETVRRLTALRARHPALRSGRTLHLALTRHAYVYARVSANAAAIVALNNGAEPETLEFPTHSLGLAPATILRDQLASAPPIHVGAAKVRVTLPPRSAAVYATSR